MFVCYEVYLRERYKAVCFGRERERERERGDCFGI